MRFRTLSAKKQKKRLQQTKTKPVSGGRRGGIDENVLLEGRSYPPTGPTGMTLVRCDHGHADDCIAAAVGDFAFMTVAGEVGE